ncbi:polysaccharide pyruvyl transferase family protein [Psychroserpens sp.]|uniref:polysaccharide pyruvyl transferase family protein n=1 Tax=Psychroserpens sp. TaxID=2020870 RepID=UPI003858D146
MFKLHIFWHDIHSKDGKENYGDALAPFICGHLSGKTVVKAKLLKSKKYRYLKKHYFTIGSIIKRVAKNSIVWGSGIIKKDENVPNAKFLLVRGPRTRQRLLNLGYNVPEKYGDPALLLPQFIINDVQKKYKLGIIPHYVDFELVCKIFEGIDNVKVIDLITNDVKKTTYDILECENIVSSSLHGLIVPHAYGIQTLWMKFSNNLSGDNTKFYDYFESVGIKYDREFEMSDTLKSEEELLKFVHLRTDLLLPNKDMLALRQKELLETCPFIKTKLN